MMKRRRKGRRKRKRSAERFRRNRIPPRRTWCDVNIPKEKNKKKHPIWFALFVPDGRVLWRIEGEISDHWILLLWHGLPAFFGYRMVWWSGDNATYSIQFTSQRSEGRSEHESIFPRPLWDAEKGVLRNARQKGEGRRDSHINSQMINI